MTEVQKTSIVYEKNQWEVLLAYKRHVGMHTKHIDIHHNFLGYMVEDKYIEITYIRSE